MRQTSGHRSGDCAAIAAKAVLMLVGAYLLSCDSPDMDRLFPMEEYLQGGWYRIGWTPDTSVDASSLGPTMDTTTTIEVFFFSGHTMEQYYRLTDHVEKYVWSFLATDTTLHRSNDSVSQTLWIHTLGDTLLIHKSPYYQWFCRYYLDGVPSTWPDTVVFVAQ